jgi:hypothetical protein
MREQFLAAVRTGRIEVLPGTTGPDRVAELEQLARDMLATFKRDPVYGDGPKAQAIGYASADQIARWHSTLKGPSS